MLALRGTILSAVAVASFALTATGSAQTPAPVNVTVDVKAASTPFPHFWEQTFGSGRAVLSLRQSYRDDLLAVKGVTDFEAVRFHGIFMDDVGLYDPNAQTQNPGQAAQAVESQSPYNFSYIDQIYDGLLANHV